MRRTRGKARSIAWDKELPPIPTRALPQSKDNLANVLDVGLSLCLVRTIPHPHLLSIHRELDDCVVIAERLLVRIRLLFKLLLQRLQGTRNHTPNSPNELVVFCLSSRLSFLHKLLALEHLLTRIFDERLSQIEYPIFNLLLEGLALGVIL